jgi:hypothetical protein
MAQRKKDKTASQSYRLKEPLNPSVRGTGKQSEREDKGTEAEFTTRHFGEGAGHPPGHGRGGKADRG